MGWLTALLAFATTMLMFAIVVATLVETIHRIWGLRGQGMRLMLENLYDKVIAPKLPEATRPTPSAFAELILENRAIAPREGEPKPGRLARLLRWMVDSSVMNDIPVEVFTQKLADNRLVGAADNFTDEVVRDIAQKYEAFGQEVGAYFERRARLLSVVVAFFVAWMFYVHPYNLAVTYIKNPEIAQNVADRAADSQAKYAVLVEKLNAAAAAELSSEETIALRRSIAQLRKDLAAAKVQTQELQDIGVPVGWPDQEKMKECDWSHIASQCKFAIAGGQWTKPSFADVFWLLVGGLLVGLGAPFWAQAVSSISASRDVTRKITEIVTPGKALAVNAPAPVAPTAVIATPELTTPVATFRLARQAQPE